MAGDPAEPQDVGWEEAYEYLEAENKRLKTEMSQFRATVHALAEDTPDEPRGYIVEELHALEVRMDAALRKD
ncbi:MAG: hypothetical protein ACR2RL_21565 [Gammaproteobacteria bacterium]